MRCVIITSWPSAETSLGLLSRWSFKDRTASEASSRSTDWRLIARSDWPTSVSAFCWAITTPALFSARSTNGIALSIASCTPDGAAGTLPSPVFRLRTLLASTTELSWTSGNAAGLPVSACDTDLASRCDCISAWPLAATCAEPRPAETNERIVSAIRPTRPSASITSRMRCCSAAGRSPISGNAVPSGAAPESASCRRVSVKSASPDGTASEMIEEDCALPSPACAIASNAAPASVSPSGRSVAACAMPRPGR